MVRFAAFVGIAPVALALAVGCGGNSGSNDAFGPDPDFGSLDTRLSTPTGTLTSDGIARAVEAVDAVRSPAASIALLSHDAPSKTSCAALGHGDPIGTCACPQGGVFDYDFAELQSANAGSNQGRITLRMRLVHCRLDTTTFDGTEFAQITHGGSTLIDAQLDLSTPAGAAQHVDVWRESDTWWARAQVGDGAIVVGVPTDGDAEHVLVKDRASVWSCARDGEKACTHVTDGTTHDPGK
jgi:hypothetical protein